MADSKGFQSESQLLNSDRPLSGHSSGTEAPVKPVSTSAPPNDSGGEIKYPPMSTVALIMIGLFCSIFLTALDRTIIGTAIPTITDEFNSLGDVGWYASAYLLTGCGFLLVMGRIYTFYNPKWVFLTSVGIFELGSVVCGAAPTSTSFIIGRAVAGIGNAGVFSGAIPIFIRIIPLQKRPMWTGLFGMVFGVASVVGPLLGGAFTDKLSWRWCFYINLPIGAVTAVLVFFMLELPAQASQQQRQKKLTWREQLERLDPIGTAVFLPGIICLLLALQWGGVTYPWSNVRIVVLLVLFVILISLFAAIQVWKKEHATVPVHIIRNQSVASGIFFVFCVGSTMMVFTYFLPIWFQAIKGASAVKSGIMNLPMVLGVVVGAFFAGFLTKKIGYYTPWMYMSSVLMPIGAGLLTTLTPQTGHAKWIGYQVILGFGLGSGMQQPSVAAQTVLARDDVSTGASLMLFTNALGGAICTSIANNVFDSKLAAGLRGVPGVNVAAVVQTGATDLREFIPADVLPRVVAAYNSAVVTAFYVGLAFACVAVFGAVFMQWRTVKDGGVAGGAGPASKKEGSVEAKQEEGSVVGGK